jgi:hypothetical protein
VGSEVQWICVLFVHFFYKKNGKPNKISASQILAEKEGFEPPDLLQSTVFKTAAIDHSAISPINTKHTRFASANIESFFGFRNLFQQKNKKKPKCLILCCFTIQFQLKV